MSASNLTFGRYWKSLQRTANFAQLNGKRYDCSGLTKNFSPYEAGKRETVRERLESGGRTPLPDDIVLAPPIKPSEIICIGLNYKGHADECGADWRQFRVPTVFGRALSSLSNPFQHVPIPRPFWFRGDELGDGVVKYDYEVELAVIIGETCFNVTEDKALKYVAGYTIANDLSERVRQLELDASGQWLGGKCCPGSFPLGPVFVPAEDVLDPQTLEMSTMVNGFQRQSSSTADMIFSVAECIAALSHQRTLTKGTVISTGTPSGVVVKANPDDIVHQWLKDGDQMELRIWNEDVDFGTQRQLCAPFTDGWAEFFTNANGHRGPEWQSPSL